MTDVVAVIPNHNGSTFIERCVEAARAGGAAEVVVVDDASSDDSPALAAAAGARVLAANGRGFAAAVNTGAAASSAPYLLLLNSDCFVEPNAIASLAAAMDADTTLALCGAHLVNADGSPAKSCGPLVSLTSALSGSVVHHDSRPASEASGAQHVPFVPLACALVRRLDWDAVGGLDERYHFYFEDYDLSWELGRRGRGVAVCWDASALHVGGGSSSAQDPQRWFAQYHESRARYIRKRYPVGWLAYAAAWPPLALLHALRWLARGGRDGRRWARAYAAAAVAGLGRA